MHSKAILYICTRPLPREVKRKIYQQESGQNSLSFFTAKLKYRFLHIMLLSSPTTNHMRHMAEELECQKLGVFPILKSNDFMNI